MKIHKIILEAKVVERSKVGNAISLQYEYDGAANVVVYGSNGTTTLSAKPGQMISIQSSGLQPPKVLIMLAPKDPVKLVFWKNGFYAARRVKTKAELNTAVLETEATFGYTSDAGNCAVAYREIMLGQRGVPFRWWAGINVTEEEAEMLINKVLSYSVSDKADF